MAFNAVAVAQDGQQRLTTGDHEFPGPSIPGIPGQMTILDKPSALCANYRGQATTKLDVPMDTCLSADFTLDNNVFLSSPGWCPGGSRRPYVALFPTTDCTGDWAHSVWWERPSGIGYVGSCFGQLAWNLGDISPPTGQWSMIFRCGDADTEPADTMKIHLPEASAEEEAPSTNFDEPCIETGSEEDGSYALWCTGWLERPQKPQSKTKSGTKSDARAWALPMSLGAFGLAVCFVAGW